MDYDPVSPKMRSCVGWTEAELAREAEYVGQRAALEGGQGGEYFWVFARPRGC